MPSPHISKIVSGGQTSVDRAALDVAIFLGIDHSGWCPQGRRSESGRIPEIYQLRETESRDYSVRTEKNVIESDGTLVLYQGKLSGGTELTYKLAQKHKRPHLCVDLNEIRENDNRLGESVRQWVKDRNIGTLNIAGPRESNSPGIAKLVEEFLIKTFSSEKG